MSKPVTPLTFEESEKLLSFILYNGTNRSNLENRLRNHLIALLMLDAGLRVGEVIRITLGQLWKFDQPIATLDLKTTQTKTKQARSIPTTSRLKTSISRYVKTSEKTLYSFDDDFLFTRRGYKEALTTRTIEYMIEKAAIASLGRAVRPHQLRHTFATNLMRICTTPIVQRLLGHKHLSSTQVYTHPNNHDYENAIKALENVKSLENSQKT